MLQVDTNAQIINFLMSIVLGFVVCLLYDFLRALHKTTLKGFVEVLITDTLFWLFSAFLTFCFLIIRCNGIFRGYVIFGMLLGFIAFRSLISSFVLRFFVFFIGILLGIFHFISSKIRYILVSINKYLKKYLFIIKKVLHNKITVMYNQLKLRSNSKKGA